jgi:hypothetical protein
MFTLKELQPSTRHNQYVTTKPQITFYLTSSFKSQSNSTPPSGNTSTLGKNQSEHALGNVLPSSDLLFDFTLSKVTLTTINANSRGDGDSSHG